jgi:hypothetical protein
MKLETLQQIKIRHYNELSGFDKIFWAFSNAQLAEGMTKLNAEPKDLVSIGHGGFVLKSHYQEFKDLLTRHANENKQHRKDKKNLLEALVYELQNHEYCISGDETDALDALGLSLADIPRDIFKKACMLAA